MRCWDLNIPTRLALSTTWRSSTRAQGRYPEAEPLYQQALAIAEKALGLNHLNVATCLNNLAALYRSQGKYAKAEPLLKRTIAIREKGLGLEHPEVAMSLENYIALLRKVDRNAEADKLQSRVEEIRAKSNKRPSQ